NTLLLKLAREGRRVLRLKGGDPFVFGRGGEEQAWLHQHGVECFVVPGITSAFGCSALNGLPLTHRDAAQMVTLATGHLQNGELRLDWQALATGNQTVVFYMGLANAAIIREKLIAHGRAPGTPVALIERGATPQQRRCITTLNQLPDSILSHGFQPPTLIIVGDVVRHAAHADAWLPAFESLQEAVSCG
ncbi:MAG: uroporphyrinogen-III C-methyltransferase, partial [Gammaproteobacteria bacterium]